MRAALQQEITLLDKAMPDYETLEDLQLEQKQTEAQLAATRYQLKQHLEHKEWLEQTMAECRERLPQLADAEAGLERAKSRMEAAETFFENMRLLYEVYCQRDRAQQTLRFAQGEFDDARKEQEETRESLMAYSVRLREQLPQYQKRTDLQREIQQKFRSLGENAQLLEAQQGMLHRTELEVETCRKLLAQDSEVSVSLGRLEAELTGKNARLDALHALQTLLQDAERMIAEYKQLKSLYQSRKQEEEAAQSAYTAAYREFLDQQAGILAEALTEGTPCPVCGAVQHPAPARRSADAPTQAELEAKQRHWDKTRKALEQASGSCQLLRARLEERKAALHQQYAQLSLSEDQPPEAQLAAALHALEEGTEALTRKREELSALQKGIQAAVKRLPQLTEALEQSRKTASDAEQVISALKGELKGLRDQELELDRALLYDSCEAAQEAIAFNDVAIQRIEEKYHTAQQAFTEAQAEMNRLQGIYDTRFHQAGEPEDMMTGNQQAIAQHRQAQADSEENKLFRKLLKLQEQRRDFTFVSASVLAGSESNWTSSLTLSHGTDSDIAVGDCVVSAEGYLVGVVSEVGLNWSTVLTVIDTDTELGARIFRTGETAVAEGDFSLMGEGKLKLSYLTSDDEVLTGDQIVTSGLGGYYPSGLVIGAVESVQTGDDGLARYAVLTPMVDFDALTEVFVIIDHDIVE